MLEESRDALSSGNALLLRSGNYTLLAGIIPKRAENNHKLKWLVKISQDTKRRFSYLTGVVS